MLGPPERWHLPRQEEAREHFLEEERNIRPRELIYRFYVSGGFWLCKDYEIAHFLESFPSSALAEMVPFIRIVLQV
jgi:hypothetical protein